MAYVNVAEWKPDQVTDWLKGLDVLITPYIHSFLNNHVSGQQLLNLGPDDLDHLGIVKIGMQEIILEGVEHLRNIHYELDRENIQLLAMRLSCMAHSLHNELYRCVRGSERLSTQILADIANIVSGVKPLIAWLDRPGFAGEGEYVSKRREVLSVALRMATCGQRDRFAEAPSATMLTASAELAAIADSMITDIQDPLILQPASLDLATIKKRSSDDLGFYIIPSSRKVHQISELKLNSAAHQCGKIEPGDEIVQINYQTVVGWDVKHVMGLLVECPTEVLLTLKKRPRHTKVYGQIYIKPYRLPSKKRSPHPFSTRHRLNLNHQLSNLTIHLKPVPLNKVGEDVKKIEAKQECRLSSSSDEEVTVQHNLVVPSNLVQRRATITGASPLSKRPPFDMHELWHDLKLEKENANKKSTTSVIDFEDRLNSSSIIKDEPLEMEVKEIPVKKSASVDIPLESLSIKQRIELFSAREEAAKQPVPLRIFKAQSRTNDESNQNIKSLKKVNFQESKMYENQVKVRDVGENVSTVQITCTEFSDKEEELPTINNTMLTVIDTSSKDSKIKEVFLSNDLSTKTSVYLNKDSRADDQAVKNSNLFMNLKTPIYQECLFTDALLSGKRPSFSDAGDLRSHYSSSTDDDFTQGGNVLGATEYPVGEEHGRVVETINRHLLDGFGGYSGIDADHGGLERLSGSLPHHGRQRHGIALDESFTNSLPLFPHRHCRSDLFYEMAQVDDGSECGLGTEWERESVTSTDGRGSIDSLPVAASRSFSSLQELGGGPRESAAMPTPSSVPSTILSAPPLPPPRPSLSRPPNACYRAIIAARSIGKASPKAQRKKNPLLGKGRSIGVKELPNLEISGWLEQRCRRGSGTWNRRWCLISANTLYAFINRQSGKAESMICLPGFTVSPAEEVKSRPFAFKVYHDGTSFYFAAESYTDFSSWMDAIAMATLAPNSHSKEIMWSESEGEEEMKVNKKPTPAPRSTPTQLPPPVIVPPPLLSPSPHIPQSSQHSVASNPPKKFGSLRKLTCRSGSNFDKDEKASGSSLDRKCRRILGNSTPIPMPTPQYRSYRRVQNTPLPPSPPPRSRSTSDTSDKNKPPPLDLGPPPTSTENGPPQLVLPLDMADYRQTTLQMPFTIRSVSSVSPVDSPDVHTFSGGPTVNHSQVPQDWTINQLSSIMPSTSEHGRLLPDPSTRLIGNQKKTKKKSSKTIFHSVISRGNGRNQSHSGPNND